MSYDDIARGAQRRIDEKEQAKKILETMTHEQLECVARVAEDFFRRGFQQGHLGQELRHDLDEWRFRTSLDLAPAMIGGPETSSLERVVMEFRLREKA